MPVSSLILERLSNNADQLSSIQFCRDRIDDTDVQQIFNALESNNTLTAIHLSHNQISDVGGKTVAKFLESNTYLTTLDLVYNNIGDEGAQAIAEAIKINSSLKSLWLRNNDIGKQGVQALLDALISNTHIEYLSLIENQINPQQILIVKELLKRNKLLNIIHTLDLSKDSDCLKLNETIEELHIIIDRFKKLPELHAKLKKDCNGFIIHHLLSMGDVISALNYYLEYPFVNKKDLLTLGLAIYGIEPEYRKEKDKVVIALLSQQFSDEETQCFLKRVSQRLLNQNIGYNFGIDHLVPLQFIIDIYKSLPDECRENDEQDIQNMSPIELYRFCQRASMRDKLEAKLKSSSIATFESLLTHPDCFPLRTDGNDAVIENNQPNIQVAPVSFKTSLDDYIDSAKLQRLEATQSIREAQDAWEKINQLIEEEIKQLKKSPEVKFFSYTIKKSGKEKIQVLRALQQGLDKSICSKDQLKKEFLSTCNDNYYQKLINQRNHLHTYIFPQHKSKTSDMLEKIGQVLEINDEAPCLNQRM